MSESTKRQQVVLWAFAFGFAIGGIVLHYVEAALAPTDNTEAGRKISDLHSHVAEQGETIERLDSEKSQLTKQVSDLQDSVNRANKEVEEAKAAKPGAFGFFTASCAISGLK
jgi:peptidoglycan hydrolase CwlO-like protein